MSPLPTSSQTNPAVVDPSIVDLGEQLDAFVAKIQARLQAIADCEGQSQSVAENGNKDISPMDRLTAIKQRLANRMEASNES